MSSAAVAITRLRARSSTSPNSEVFHFTATASMVKDFDRLSLEAASAPPNKIRRRNAVTEAEFEAAFPSCEARERLVGLWRARKKGEKPLHKDLEGLSLWEEGERQRKRPANRNRHKSEKDAAKDGDDSAKEEVVEESPASNSDRPRRRRQLRRKSGDLGQQQQQSSSSSSSSSCSADQVASIRLHEDLRNLRSPPDVLPRSLLRHLDRKVVSSRSNHPPPNQAVALYRPPASLVEDILVQGRNGGAGGDEDAKKDAQ